ncbi:MAG: leucine-rich repeat domain-containing protein, partial [Spirochaetaceae bacterium]|nr:leucine-rich repeat domain-containing protein [Spirochaetaceae bacterium]
MGRIGKKVPGYVLCLIMAAVMVLLMKGTARADETEDGFVYSDLGNGTVQIDAYEGSDGNVIVPAEIDGKAVAKIRDIAFNRNVAVNAEIESVTFLGEIAEIESNTFSNLPSLTSVTFKENVGKINSNSFSDCPSLKTIVFEKNVGAICDFAVSECKKLENVIFSGNVGTIGTSAIYSEYIKDIVFQGEVGELGNGAIYCERIDSITFMKKVGQVGQGAFCYVSSTDTLEITFKDDVESLESMALEDIAGNAVITFEGDVRNMGYNLLGQSSGSLTLVFKKGMNMIPQQSFDGADSAKLNLVFEGRVKIEDKAFKDCSILNSVMFKGEVETIGEEAFSGCGNLNDVTFMKDVKTIGEKAFSECESLETVNFDGNVGTIGDGAFNKSGSDQFEIILGPEKTVQTIGNNAFAECKGLRDIIFIGVNLVGVGAFAKCPDIRNVELYSSSEDYLTIDDMCFLNCPHLKKVIIGGNGSVSFGGGAFNGCTSLSEFQFGGGGSIFFASEVFSGCTKLTELRLFGSGFDFANDVFKDSGITEVYITDFDYLSFEYHTFENATNLNRAFFSGKHIIIGEEAFARSTIELLEITGDVEDIGNSAFSGCSNLKVISISGDVSFIGKEAFSGCIDNAIIIFNGDVDKIEEKAFAGCSGLKSVVFSGDVKTIGSKAFENSTLLKTVFIPKSAAVASDAFPANTNVVYYELQESSSYYCVTGVTPVVKVTLNGTTLVPGEDYQVTYMKKSQSVGNIVNEGTYTVSV